MLDYARHGGGELANLITFDISGPNVGTLGLYVELMLSSYNGL